MAIIALTEVEAMVKECRVHGMMESAGNKRFPMCVASRCMGWEWKEFGWPAYVSPISGKLIAKATPGKGVCAYKR